MDAGYLSAWLFRYRVVIPTLVRLFTALDANLGFGLELLWVFHSCFEFLVEAPTVLLILCK